MISCMYMNKDQKEYWLPVLFDLYYENMHSIAPSGLPYTQERSLWLSEVSPALDKDPRQVLLCLDGDQLLGYIQYYTRGSLLMIEELQITPSHQGTLLFHHMCRYLHRNLPAGIDSIEAYAHIPNLRSVGIMKRLSFQEIGEATVPGLIHLRADAEAVFRRLI